MNVTVGHATNVVTLPATAAGLQYVIRCGASGQRVAVSPAAADKIMGADLAGVDDKDRILAAAREVRDRLARAGIAVRLDERDNLSPGFKFNEWELLGVPLRIELGPKDLERGSVMTVKRPNRAKAPVPLADLEARVPELLGEVQKEMFEAARARREAATFAVDSWDAFRERNDSTGGFLLAHFCGRGECETSIQEETKATVRCLAFGQSEEAGRCVRCGEPSPRRVHFAKAY